MADDDDGPDDDELEESLRALTEPIGTDRLRLVGLVVASLVPGPLALALELSTRTAHARRLVETVRLAVREIEFTRDRVDELEVQTEAFAETVFTVVDEAQRSSEAAKRRAFAAILAHSLIPGGPGHEERLLFLDVVRRAREIHLLLLAVLLNPPAAAESFGSSLIVALNEALPSYQGEVLELAFGDLNTWGFSNTPAGSLRAMLTRADLAGRLTDLGHRFVEFVTLTAPDE